MDIALAPQSPRQPRQLDRLNIPGMKQNVIGYDGGVGLWLLTYGLTVVVDRNWLASPGDVINIVRMPDMLQLATLMLKEGDEAANHYFFSIEHKNLPDGEVRLGYVVHFKEGGEAASYTLSVLVKTDLPGGRNNNPPFPGVGHSELKFTLSTTIVDPPDAIRGVTVTVAPYPNMHARDMIHFSWASVLIIQQVAGVGRETVFNISRDQLMEGGDGTDLLVGFLLVDQVGNTSTDRSADTKVQVNLDSTRLEGPAIITDGPVDTIDIERLNGEDLLIEMHNSAAIAPAGSLYDIDFRSYPPNGGVIVHRDFERVITAGRTVTHNVPYGVVRAAAGGRVEIKYVLRKQNPAVDLYSRITVAKVFGSIVRLEAPYFAEYPGHTVHPIPNSALVSIPYYPWRQAQDKLTLIMRYVRGLNDVVVFSESKLVGDSWPEGAPFQRLIYRQDLERFDGYKPYLYYVVEPRIVEGSTPELNESLRQLVQIGLPVSADR